MDNDALQDRIANWSFWAKTSARPPISCNALESRYKSPQHWESPQPRTVIDILDAIEVEKAIIKLPRPQLNILVYNYIRPTYNFDAFCSKNRIRGNKHVNKSEQYKIELHRAETMLKNILYKGIDRFNLKDYIQSNLIPVRESVAV